MNIILNNNIDINYKDICIFHHTDMDGISSLFLIKQYIREMAEKYAEYEYPCITEFPINYEPDVKKTFINCIKCHYEPTIFIVDYSFTENTKDILDALLDNQNNSYNGCNIIWIDHHDSSIQLCDDHKEYDEIVGVRNKAFSGAGLVYLCLFRARYDETYFFDISLDQITLDKCMPSYIKYISDYDTFSNKYIESTYFKLAYDSEKDITTFLYRLYKLSTDKDSTNYEGTMKAILTKGESIYEYIKVDNENFLKDNAFMGYLSGYSCLVVNKRTNSWVFGNHMNEWPFVCTYYFDGELYHYSIYNGGGYDKIDLSAIAEARGGGGHKGAAGFTEEYNIFEATNQIKELPPIDDDKPIVN